MTLRGVNWVAVLGATALGAVILTGCVAFAGATPPLTYARLALVALAAAAAFVLDEPAAAAVDAAPTTLRRRTATRVTAVTVPFGVWVVGLLALDRRDVHIPLGHLVVEGLGVLAVAVAMAAVVRRAGRVEPGDVAATAVGATILGIVVFDPPPHSVPLFPVMHNWSSSSILWAALVLVAAVLLVAASRDAAAR